MRGLSPLSAGFLRGNTTRDKGNEIENAETINGPQYMINLCKRNSILLLSPIKLNSTLTLLDMTRKIIRSTIEYGCSIFLTSISIYGFSAYFNFVKDYLERRALDMIAKMGPSAMIATIAIGAPLAFILLICS